MSDNEIKLQPKDGKIHVLYVLLSRTKKINDMIVLSDNKVETIANFIQNKGYEIVDIKFCYEVYSGHNILIMYK